MKLKRILSGLTAAVMAFSAVSLSAFASGADEAASDTYTKTNINTIKYYFTFSGLTTEKSVVFSTTDMSSWSGIDKSYDVSKGDGDYVFEVTNSSPSGMRNLGYFASDKDDNSGSSAKATITKIVVNDTYEMTYTDAMSHTLDIGGSNNALVNIWTGDPLNDGDKFLTGTNCYMEYKYNSALTFYVKSEATDIESDVKFIGEDQSTWTLKYKVTEAELASAGVSWSSATKFTVYVKMTDGDGYSLVNAIGQLGHEDENGEPVGKGSSKYLVGVDHTASGKSGNAIQRGLVGNAGTGCYAFPEININKTASSGSLTDDDLKEITIRIRIATTNTDCELIGIKFNNGALLGYSDGKYTNSFTVPVCEAVTEDADPDDDSKLEAWEKNDTTRRNNLKMTLDYCASMDSSKYTADSWNDFQSAIVTAQAVYENQSATGAQLLSARNALEKVKAKLVFIDSESNGNPLPFRSLPADETVAEMGAGTNLGNTMDGHSGFTPNETSWQSITTTKEIITAMHDAGINTVRIPVTWGTMIDADNGYAINKKWISRVQDIVDYCVEQDMYAIINIHHDGAETTGWLNTASNDIDAVYEQFECVWRNIAEYFKDYDEHLIFESMNEITSGSTESSKNSAAAQEYDTPIIMNLNQIFVNVVRSTGSNNARRWLAVVSHYAGIGTSYNFELPEDSYNDENRLMFATHIYKASTNTTWTYSEVYQVVDNLKKMVKKFGDIPMYLGEYGTRTYPQTGTETGYNDVARAYFSEIVNRACQVNGVVPIVWDQGYGSNGPYEKGLYTFFDRAALKPVFKTIYDAMMRGTYLAPSEKNFNNDFSDIEEGATVTAVTSITPKESSLSLSEGDYTTAEVTSAPAENNDVILWKTSNPDIVTVSNGRIHAKKLGEAVVTAFSQADSSVKAEIKITVSAGEIKVPAADINTPDSMSLTIGDPVNVNASVVPDNSDDTLTYTSTNEKIAVVNSMGKVTGVSSGKAYIIVSAASGMTKIVPVTVVDSSAKKEITLALHVLYGSSELNYWSGELGDSVTVTEDGTYSLSFDCDTDLSSAAKKAGVTSLKDLTSIYIKDLDVTNKVYTKSSTKSCTIQYTKVTVNGKDLTLKDAGDSLVTKEAVNASGVFDTGGPINGWDGNAVLEATTSDNVANFTGIDNPTKITVEFKLTNLTFNELSLDGTPAQLLKATSDKEITADLSKTDTVDIQVRVSPKSTTTLTSFISEDMSVAYTDVSGELPDSSGYITKTIKLKKAGKTTIKVIQDDTDLTLEFTINVIDGSIKPTPSKPTASVTASAKTTAKVKAPTVAKVKKVKAKSAKKSLKVSWKKIKGAKGYIIQASAKKNFKKLAVKKTLKANKKKITLRNGKLKKGRRYYVRVRAYKTYKDSKGVLRTVKGAWSKKIKSAKVK